MLNHPSTPWVARVALLLFGGWTATIVVEHGYTGFITVALAEDWAAQLFVDLVIALLLFMPWMANDAQERGKPFWPWLILTLFLGSIGPLLYLSLRAPGVEAADSTG